EPEKPRRIEARIHAGDDGELTVGRHRELALLEPRRIALVGCSDLVDYGHASTSPLLYQLKREAIQTEPIWASSTLAPRWRRTLTTSSRISSAPTRRRRRGWPIRPSTTTTGRRPTSAGA